MMKKILFALAFLVCLVSSAQIKPNFDGVNYTPLTTVEINALTGMLEGDLQYNETTKTMYVYNGSSWINTGVPLIDASGFSGNLTTSIVNLQLLAEAVDSLTIAGGSLSSADIDTFAELDAIVADKSLVNLEDAQTFSSSAIQFNNNISVLGSANLQVGQSLLGGAEISTGNNYTRINGYSYTNPTSARIYFLMDDLAPGTNGVETVLEASENDITYNGTSLLSGGGSSPPFDDTTALVQDPVDNTKQARLDVGALTTGNTRVLTMPDADVDLGALTSANLATGSVTTTEIALGTIQGNDIDVNTITSGNILDDAILPSKLAISQTLGAGLDGYVVVYDNTNNEFDLVASSTIGAADQTLSLSGTGNKDLTISGTGGNTIDLTGVDGIDADNIVSKGTLRTSPTQYTDIYGQTQANYNTDGAPGAGELVIITDASPAEVVTTATIAMDGWKMYDDQTADAATITLSDCDPGETLTVYINRASAPTLAGTGLTFNQLPSTTAFAAATQMMIIFEVAYDGTTIDYYYVER